LLPIAAICGVWLGGFELTAIEYKRRTLPAHVLIPVPGLVFLFFVWPFVAWDVVHGASDP
jgi:hypothetical protein